MNRPDDFNDTDFTPGSTANSTPSAAPRSKPGCANTPHDAARVRLWAADRDALRAHLDPVLGEPVPQRCSTRAERGARRLDGGWAQAGLPRPALLAAGGVIGAAALAWQGRQVPQRSVPLRPAHRPAGCSARR